MATVTESPQRAPLPANGHADLIPNRIVPIPTPTPTIQMSAPSPGEPMEITSSNNASTTSPSSKNNDTDANGASKHTSPTDQSAHNSIAMPAAPAAAAAAVHQPKIVQTAFIHKLYSMLEDPSIQHLISWSASAESFVMSPSADFSKVLAQYFKHTNISSFVRQLNMYGFHKVSDVFHTTNPETALWEFKHGNGNFKRGDLVGLREIKRRASRHALVHREYPNSKPSPSQPGTPAEPMPPPSDGSEMRMPGLEHTLYDLSMRLQRSEENAHYMHIKQQAVMETMSRLLQFNQELSRTVLSLVPSPDNPVHRDVLNLQSEMARQADMLRTIDDPQESPFASSRAYFTNVENAPVSPRQLPQDDPRRNANLAVPQPRGQNFYRPPVPSNLSISTRRPYGSIGGGSVGGGSVPQASSPLRGAPPPPPPGPHPLAQVEAPPGSLARRHTSADIRAHGWQPSAPPPFASGPPSGPPSGPWPSSPSRLAPEDQRLRESLSTYSLQNATQVRPLSRPTTPPGAPFSNGGGGDTFGNWSWNSANRDNKNLAIRDHSGPPTRRGSMAHILNPTDTAERDDEDEDPRGDDDRKRKRMQ
ncbi:HSF-type DNA-binding-domain-containing protein [Colletotrichum phormii]|uniref:HSF-type DNA-binding-domain-containing protein n=1 Tax=Colletotrichum phormii TaxID=359342 RepID=A0AAJ0A027_9PEZI|nr:HSF-type DNA-binding-domain-containing protein [Colletotrichum phormii]KAK1639692.1 HSF-type DNA-binding-domain-containing protein [Colletotrichum phormii]